MTGDTSIIKYCVFSGEEEEKPPGGKGQGDHPVDPSESNYFTIPVNAP